MIDPTAEQVGIGGVLFLSALFMLLKLKPWERKLEIPNGIDKKINDLSRDIHEVHVMLFGVDGRGGLAEEIDALRKWRHWMESEHKGVLMKLDRLEGRRKGSSSEGSD